MSTETGFYGEDRRCKLETFADMMIRRIFKSIFASPLLIRNFFKKCRFDNFVGGLIFGALFSLLVNVATVQVQEAVTRQKYLEALEHEVISHLLQANSIADRINRTRENEEDANPYSFKERYSTSIWDSGEVLGYIYGLDPEVQAQILTYLKYIIQSENKFLDQVEDSINQFEFEYMACVFRNTESGCEEIGRVRREAANYYEEIQLDSARQVQSHVVNLTDSFHPTQDRLDSIVLRFLMGIEVLEIMKRPK